jgi:hypothetical protein
VKKCFYFFALNMTRLACLVLLMMMVVHVSGDHEQETLSAGRCELPEMPRIFQLRERFWSVLKTVDIVAGDGQLLGSVYMSAFNLDGRAKWVIIFEKNVDILSAVEASLNNNTFI